MPLYEYICDACEKKFTIRHSHKETITDCILCKKKESVAKVLSSTNFVLPKKQDQNEKIGTTTNKAIEEAKEDLRNQKSELKKKNK